MTNANLPSLSLGSTAWRQAPPDPLSRPDLYDGLLWRRVVAYLVDVLAIGVLYAVASVVFFLAGVLSFGLLTPLGIVTLAVLPVSYHSFFLGHQAATPGMRMFDVEVRSWTGQRLDYFQAFLVTVMFYVTVALTAWLVLIVAPFNRRRRTLHDFLGGMVAVRRSGLASDQPKPL